VRKSAGRIALQVLIPIVFLFLFSHSFSLDAGAPLRGKDSGAESHGISIYFKVSEIEPGISLYRIKTWNAGFFTRRGRIGDPIITSSGERLELWWRRVFPRFELLYFKDSTGEKGRTIGKCDFLGGCNEAFFLALCASGKDTHHLFLRIEWTSKETCYNRGELKPIKEKTYIYYPTSDTLLMCQKGICRIE
jgi:hypothetical protein